jgi:hypothetical protein
LAAVATLPLLLAAVGLILVTPARADATPSVPPAFASPLDNTQLVVNFKKTTGAAAVSDTLTDAGVTKVGTVSLSGAAIVQVPELAQSSALAALHADPDVASARIDPIVQAVQAPNDPQYDGAHTPCANSLGCWPYQELNLAAAWDTTTGSASVTVAVIDTGVAPNHEDLAGAVLPGWNLFAGNANAADDNGHGTEVAGMIAARGNNGIGVVGSCWSCKILPVKVLGANGSGFSSTVANGITWATDHGAQIINLSVGGSADPALSAALNYAVSHGVFVVIAAGNAGSASPATAPGGYPGGYAQSIAGAVSVGAIDYSSALYSFSNYGSWVEVAAPGCMNTTAMDGGYTAMCGTSAAAPQVAGAAALALSYAPTLTPAQLEQKIEASADPRKPVARNGGDFTCDGPCTAYGMIDDLALLQSLGASYPPPALLSAPTFTGTARVGEGLLGTNASFSGAGPITLSHLWLRCDAAGANCAAISGATSSGYTLVAADLGATVRFQTTATSPYGTLVANSAASAAVAAAPPFRTALPTISGGSLIGTTLSGTDGSFSGSGLITTSHLWLRCDASGANCTQISGATGSSYTLAQADVGATVRFRTSASSPYGTQDADSDASPLVTASAPAPPNLSGVALVLQGVVSLGGTLRAAQPAVSYFSGTVASYRYQWLHCDASGASCTLIDGATADSYTLTAADQGYALKERIGATNNGGTVSLDSAASALLPAAPTVPTPVPPTPPVPTPPIPPAPPAAPGPSAPSSGGGGGGGGGGGAQPDLSLEITTDAPPALNGALTYRLRVYGKLGWGATDHAIATFTLPDQVTIASVYVGHGPGCSQAGQTLTCDLDWVNPGQDVTVIVQGTVSKPGTLTANATLWAKGELNLTDNQATLVQMVADPAAASAPKPGNPSTPNSPGKTTKSVPPLTPSAPILVSLKSGPLAPGALLRLAAGGLSGTPVRYQWQAAGPDHHYTNLASQTRATLTLTTSLVGKQVRLLVTIRTATGLKTVSSKATAAVRNPGA